MVSKSIILNLAVLFIICSALSPCTTFTVTTNSNGTGAGALRNAVTNASPGDTIKFSTSVSQIDLSGSDIDITKSLTIEGNGADSTVITGSSSVGIFFISGSGITVTIKDITLRSGVGTIANDAIIGGGAIQLEQGTLVVQNVEFRDNVSNQGGGGYLSYGGAVILYDNASFTNCTFDNNSVSGTNAHGGGAIYMDNFLSALAVSFTNCTFFNNWATYNGGAIHARGDYGNTNSITVTNCTFFNNFSSGPKGLDIYFLMDNNSTFISHNSIYDRSSSTIPRSLVLDGLEGTRTTRGGNIFHDTPPDFGLGVADRPNNGPNAAGLTGILALNTNTTGIRTIAISSTSSYAYNFGTPGFSEPANDARGAVRNDYIDSGAYEYWDGGILPVELSAFNAVIKNNVVELHWQTATEVNNYGFEVQRRSQKSGARSQNENPEWERIGFVEGNGNSNSINSYSFVDKNPFEGKSYYRLKQIDNDGQFEYSDIVDISFMNPDEFSLRQNYPNPFNPVTSIEYSIPSAGTNRGVFVQLKIYDLMGKEIAAIVDEEKTPGIYKTDLNASELASGVYYYVLKAGSYTSAKKMILMK